MGATLLPSAFIVTMSLANPNHDYSSKAILMPSGDQSGWSRKSEDFICY